MRITVFEYISHIHEGGAESLVRDYALMLDKDKFRPIVLTNSSIDENAYNVKALRHNNICLVELTHSYFFFKNKFLKKVWNHFFYKWILLRNLRSQILKYRPQIIHVHLEQLFYLYLVKDCLNGIKIFYTCHNEPKVHLSPQAKAQEYLAAKYFFEHNNFKIITLHNEMKEEINAMFNVTNSLVLHNGIDFSRFSNIKESKEEIRNNIRIPSESFVIGHIGRLGKAKNHLFLVDIFSEVLKVKTNAFLLLIGTGPLQEEIQNKLHLLDLDSKYILLQNRYDIPQLLKAMDVFVFPSLYEGLPVTLVESQLLGLRTVISDRVTEECFFSENAISVSLDKPASYWAQVVIDTSYKGNIKNDINSFDMNDVIADLSQIYLH